MILSFSQKLLQTIQPFKKQLSKFSALFFVGWGRRKYSRWAQKVSRFLGLPYICIEDGFVRSMGTAKDDRIFSIVVDTKGIYYDATEPSMLEELLLTYDFQSDPTLMAEAEKAIDTLIHNNITKYNHASDFDGSLLDPTDRKRVLVIAQTFGDMSLKYGKGETFTTDQMLTMARDENPGASLYLKIHPDVLNGLKKSDIDVLSVQKDFIILDQDVNAMSLLKLMDKVYTKTSQMGFEALLLDKEVVCFGMPFYAGWGLTDDRVKCERRNRHVSTIEIFAAAYILYPIYYNPYTHSPSNIIETLNTIVGIKNVSK